MLTQRQRQNWDVRVDLVRRFLPTEADSVQRIEDETTLAVAEHLKEREAQLAAREADVTRLRADLAILQERLALAERLAWQTGRGRMERT